jgi:hypothetical protein
MLTDSTKYMIYFFFFLVENYSSLCGSCRGCPSRVGSLRSSVCIKQVAAGCNHTVLMSADGRVYTFGNNQVCISFKSNSFLKQTGLYWL